MEKNKNNDESINDADQHRSKNVPMLDAELYQRDGIDDIDQNVPIMELDNIHPHIFNVTLGDEGCEPLSTELLTSGLSPHALYLMLMVLRQRPTFNFKQDDWCDASGWDKRKVSKLIQELESKGFVSRVGHITKPMYYFYARRDMNPDLIINRVPTGKSNKRKKEKKNVTTGALAVKLLNRALVNLSNSKSAVNQLSTIMKDAQIADVHIQDALKVLTEKLNAAKIQNMLDKVQGNIREKFQLNDDTLEEQSKKLAMSTDILFHTDDDDEEEFDTRISSYSPEEHQEHDACENEVE